MARRVANLKTNWQTVRSTMPKEWILGTEGRNLKFKREALLNYGMNRWGLNKAQSVAPTSEPIRACAPKALDDWEKFYFGNATQKREMALA
jgi:MjaI restriction endonuclease